MKETIESYIGHQVKEAVKEREKPQHPAKPRQPVESSNSAQRSDGQRDKQKDQGEHARRAGDEFQRIRPHLLSIDVPQQQRQRHQAINEQDEFGKECVFHILERGHPARHSVRSTVLNSLQNLDIRASRSGGQDARAPNLEIRFQIHALIEISNLFDVPIEQERIARSKFANPVLSSLTPARMIDAGVHI